MEMILPAVFGAAMEREVRFLNGEDGLGLSLVLVLDLEGFVVVAAADNSVNKDSPFPLCSSMCMCSMLSTGGCGDADNSVGFGDDDPDEVVDLDMG